jgi:hypothetical protein
MGPSPLPLPHELSGRHAHGCDPEVLKLFTRYLLQCRRIAARESSTSSRALLTCDMPPRAAYRLIAAIYEFMAALYSPQSRSRSEQMRRIGLDRIAFGRELSEHVSRKRSLRPTYGIPELLNCSA